MTDTKKKQQQQNPQKPQMQNVGRIWKQPEEPGVQL